MAQVIVIIIKTPIITISLIRLTTIMEQLGLNTVAPHLNFSPKNIGRQALARLGLFGAKIWPCTLGVRGLQVGWVQAGKSPLPAKVAPWVQ